VTAIPSHPRCVSTSLTRVTVRLGKSGLKVSRIILGCMTYGNPKWQNWVLGEEEGIAHIKAAYDLGINTFDTADVRLSILHKARVSC
jgi:predicted oxidoreductase